MMLHINYYLNIPENSLIYDMIKERFLWIMHKRGWNTWIFNNQLKVVLSVWWKRIWNILCLTYSEHNSLVWCCLLFNLYITHNVVQFNLSARLSGVVRIEPSVLRTVVKQSRSVSIGCYGRRGAKTNVGKHWRLKLEYGRCQYPGISRILWISLNCLYSGR